jgi:hypothetical protein
MISVARIVVRRSVLNKTRKWQNCDPRLGAASVGREINNYFKKLGSHSTSMSKPPHAYVIFCGDSSGDWQIAEDSRQIDEGSGGCL